MSEERKKCEICGNELSFSWTDTHGVGQCTTCGSPYRMYHYDEDKKLIEKPPELQVKKEWIPVFRKYWNEFKRVMPSGFSFPQSYGTRYELATHDDEEVFFRWLEKQNPERLASDGAS